MLTIDYNGFVNECVKSALDTLNHHEAQLKFADKQIAFWQKFREREQNMWNNAYVDYCDWLKQKKESDNESLHS